MEHLNLDDKYPKESYKETYLIDDMNVLFFFHPVGFDFMTGGKKYHSEPGIGWKARINGIDYGNYVTTSLVDDHWTIEKLKQDAKEKIKEIKEIKDLIPK